MVYTPNNWYWIVDGDETQVYSSAVADFVPADDETYAAWIAEGNFTTRIASEVELWEVLAKQHPAGLPAVLAPKVMTPLEFMGLFTAEEQAGIASATQTNAQVMLFMLMLGAALEINVRDPRTVGGVNAMVAAELLTAERAAIILA